MAATYTLIASNTLGSDTASVTFSSIPGTYTDLLLKLSTRSDSAGNDMTLRLNSINTNYSDTELGTLVPTIYSFRNSYGTDEIYIGANSNTTDTTNTFGNTEIYIPSYTVSQNKPLSSFAVRENNAQAAEIWSNAGLWRNTDAITSITIYCGGVGATSKFVTGSSFFLYGIKNS